MAQPPRKGGASSFWPLPFCSGILLQLGEPTKTKSWFLNRTMGEMGNQALMYDLPPMWVSHALSHQALATSLHQNLCADTKLCTDRCVRHGSVLSTIPTRRASAVNGCLVRNCAAGEPIDLLDLEPKCSSKEAVGYQPPIGP